MAKQIFIERGKSSCSALISASLLFATDNQCIAHAATLVSRKICILLSSVINHAEEETKLGQTFGQQSYSWSNREGSVSIAPCWDYAGTSPHASCSKDSSKDCAGYFLGRGPGVYSLWSKVLYNWRALQAS